MSTSKSNSGSGSGSLEMSSDLASKTTKDGSGPPFPDSNSADLSTSASALSSSSDTQSKRHKPMDRDEKKAYLEDETKKNTDDLRDLSRKLYVATERRDRLLEKEKRTSVDAECLIAVKDDISDMRKRKDRLVAEMSGLRNPKELGGAPVPAQVLSDDIDTFFSKLNLLPPGQSRPVEIGSSTFPLLLQRESIIVALKAWLSNCSIEAMKKRDKESRCLPVTSAPTGSGKTIFLRILVELFRHKWDIGSFMKEHIYPQKCGEELEKFIIETITSILIDPEIENLKNATDLSSSLFLSTHPCFISFGSSTPTSSFELESFKDNPTGILISRVIFAHTIHGQGNWSSEYRLFYETHIETLKKLHDLPEVLSFFRKRNGCKHFFLAIDELLHLNPVLGGVKSSNVEVVIKSVGSTVITNDGIHAIISSLVTNPFIKYVGGSQHTACFVRLYPLLENLDLLSAHINKQRQDSNNVTTILQLLKTTGGHPKIIQDLLPWLLKVDKETMTLGNAAEFMRDKIIMCEGFSESLQRLLYIGGCVSPDDIGAICGSSGMLSRPDSVESNYLAVVPPLVLYTLGLKNVKTFGNIDLNYLVPFRISSGDKFGKFIACWFALQFRLQRPLRSLFVNYDQETSFLFCAHLFELSKRTCLFEFRNFAVFLSSLPNVQCTSVRINLSTTGNISNLFGLSALSEGYRVWVIENHSNPGFDIMISYSTISEVTKKVLLVQCKTKLVTTTEDAGDGQTVDSKNYSHSLVNCSEFVRSLEGQGWEVSFLGIYSCKVTKDVIPEVCPAGVSPKFFERCAAIGNTGTFNLLGDTFGLALELAKGDTF